MAMPGEASEPLPGEALQALYMLSRRRWAAEIGRPYAGEVERPDPGSLDLAATEDG